mgnify:CR=1 FL=1
MSKKLATNDTITYDIFNRNKKKPLHKIKDRYGEDAANPIVIANNPHTLVKIIYHSYRVGMGLVRNFYGFGM